MIFQGCLGFPGLGFRVQGLTSRIVLQVEGAGAEEALPGALAAAIRPAALAEYERALAAVFNAGAEVGASVLLHPARRTPCMPPAAHISAVQGARKNCAQLLFLGQVHVDRWSLYDWWQRRASGCWCGAGGRAAVD